MDQAQKFIISDPAWARVEDRLIFGPFPFVRGITGLAFAELPSMPARQPGKQSTEQS